MSAHLLWPIALLVFVGMAAALAKTRRRRASGLDQPWPLEAKRTLLSAPEQVLYRRLIEAFPEHIVLAQVQLLQALRFKRGAWDAVIANRISQLSVDFMVLRPDTSIVAAVELDDASHERPKRQAADTRKTHALKCAGIALLRFRAGQMPDVSAIVSAFALERAQS